MLRFLTLVLAACTATPSPDGDPPVEDTDGPVVDTDGPVVDTDEPSDTAPVDTEVPPEAIGWRVAKVSADIRLLGDAGVGGSLLRVAGLARDPYGTDWIERTCAASWEVVGVPVAVAEVAGDPCPACDFAFRLTLDAKLDLLARSGAGASSCGRSFDTVGGTGLSIAGRVWLLDLDERQIFSVDAAGVLQDYVTSLQRVEGEGYTFGFVLSAVYEGP